MIHLGEIRSEIERKSKFKGQLRVKLHKSKTKDKIEKDVNSRLPLEFVRGKVKKK